MKLCTVMCIIFLTLYRIYVMMDGLHFERGFCMNILIKFCLWLESRIGIDSGLLVSFFLTVFSFLFIQLIKIFCRRICKLLEQRKAFLYYQRINIILTIVNVLIILMLWDQYLGNIVTVISFTSAALTLALRELIFNFFAGLYIKVRRPFMVEDRIEVEGIKGDVVNINSLSFEVLEVGSSSHGDQSTGILVNLPNSYALTSSVKNYEKNFKYIWKEITVQTTLDADVEKTKELLLEIIENNEVVKRIPKKMKKELKEISPDYRIYYNKFDPIVYVEVVDSHIAFSIRYLVHPKKNRYVEDDV